MKRFEEHYPFGEYKNDLQGHLLLGKQKDQHENSFSEWMDYLYEQTENTKPSIRTKFNNALMAMLKDAQTEGILKSTPNGYETSTLNMWQEFSDGKDVWFFEKIKYAFEKEWGERFPTMNNENYEKVYSIIAEEANSGTFKHFSDDTDSCLKSGIRLTYRIDNWNLIPIIHNKNRNCTREEKYIDAPMI